MRFTALALLAVTTKALTPSRKISESAIEDCLKLTKQFEIVDVPPLDTKLAANRAQAQLETLASEKNPLAAPIHLEYYALLALVVILYVDILDVAGIVARFQH